MRIEERFTKYVVVAELGEFGKRRYLKE